MNINLSLKKSPLFKKFDIETIENLIEKTNYRIKSFKKGEYIAIERDKCTSIGIVLEGNIEIYKQYETGDRLSIGHF